jgi:hypothetical protein
MPLTYSGRVGAEERASGARERARKVRPEYAHGELRRVVTARQQAEAEFIQMLLLEEGIPSTLRRSAGFDVPDFLAAGPRDVLVPDSGSEVARALLRESDVAAHEIELAARAGPSPLRLLVAIGAAVAIVALLVWALTAAIH